MGTDTLLIEIGTEELPPTAAKTLSDSLVLYIADELKKAAFSYSEIKPYVTPRRLALTIHQVSASQPEQDIERKGPALKAAYDEHGQATKAALGFAKSCGVQMQDLQTLETDKGAWLYFKSRIAGKSLEEVLPDIIEQGLAKLPIPRPMRWGDNEVEFVRPIHWIVVMYGSRVIPCKIKNINAANVTFGHRFHSPNAISLSNADEYQSVLSKAKVVADFQERKNIILSAIKNIARQYNAVLDFPDSLLEEVCNLVEWPCAIVGEFSPDFLSIPHEALVVTMQEAQRYFPMFSKHDHTLLPYFITIANIESSNPGTIKHGNERVIKPRFEDAGFFWSRDKQHTLASRAEKLKDILFEKQLGSIFDKAQRVQSLAKYLCQQLNSPEEHAVRTAYLCKADLLTEMVNEFPKLQGIMGRYYALHDNEANEVATAIEEHYQPLQSGGKLPSSMAGKIVALSDRIDTLVGIFATGKKPTGVKDPYALRRAALGVIRIAIEEKVDFDLPLFISQSAQLLKNKLDIADSEKEVFDFIFDRLRGYFIEQGIAADTFEAVRNSSPTRLLDFADRIQAVQHFRTLSESESLAAGNKRIRNILKKATSENLSVDTKLFCEKAEQDLFEQSTQLQESVTTKFAAREYSEALTQLATLRPVIDQFFDDVMVMDEDENIRNNRIALLASVNKMFSTIADISLLQS